MMQTNWKCKREKLKGEGMETFAAGSGRRRKPEKQDEGGSKKKKTFVLNVERM